MYKPYKQTQLPPESDKINNDYQQKGYAESAREKQTLKSALQNGERDENVLTDLIFFSPPSRTRP